MGQTSREIGTTLLYQSWVFLTNMFLPLYSAMDFFGFAAIGVGFCYALHAILEDGRRPIRGVAKNNWPRRARGRCSLRPGDVLPDLVAGDLLLPIAEKGLPLLSVTDSLASEFAVIFGRNREINRKLQDPLA
jgi:hypothetical protein